MRRVFAVAGVVVLLLLGLTVAAVGSSARDLVYTDRGPVRGTVYSDSRVFQGIPYAAAPVGDLRWRAPVPAAAWREPLDATAPTRCAQGAIFHDPSSDTEDCLHVNVTTPARPRGRLPVMVWIHGGYYAFSSGGEYDGRKLAVEGNVVVVTINYRLGALGLLALPGLNGEVPGSQSGNYGLLDQQAALRWVRDNIAAFGGDPHNVTLFGESVGSMSMCAQLTSPGAKGLFHRAIGQSFACTSPLATAEEAEGTGAAFAARVGCTDPSQVLACLRGKPAAELVRNWVPGGGPVVGGRELPRQPADALRTGAFHRVPMMLGNTLDEMRFSVGLEYDAVGRPVTAAQYEQIIRDTYGPGAEQVLRRYPVGDYSSPTVALATVRTHDTGQLSTCDHLTMYREFASPPRAVPVYAYQFADRTAPPMVDLPGFDEGAEHTAELNYLFPGVFGAPLNAEQVALSSTIVRYWTNFARYGSPNGPGTPAWQRFHGAGDVLSLDIGRGGIRPVDIARASNCGFWNSLPR